MCALTLTPPSQVPPTTKHQFHSHEIGLPYSCTFLEREEEKIIYNGGLNQRMCTSSSAAAETRVMPSCYTTTPEEQDEDVHISMYAYVGNIANDEW